MRDRLTRAALRGLVGLPGPLRRLLAGPALERDGQRLDLDIQLLLRLTSRGPAMTAVPVEEQRRLTDAAAGLAEVERGVRVEAVTVPGVRDADGSGGALDACLYEPTDLPADPTGLLVFLHGGGFVLGSLVSGDPLCRTLAYQAGVRVLSVEYRLAPEHPFPAGLADTVAAVRHALSAAEGYGVAPGAVAVGGDSAGANLALTAAHELARAGEPTPAFVSALYPVTDVARAGGSRELFATGFGLGAADIEVFEHQYLPDGPDPIRPTGLLDADDLHLMPPTYLATAGFDPLRDEGEELAARLTAAGVPVVARRFPGLVHGYAGLNGLSRAAHDAVLDAASALRAGLALGPRVARAGAAEGAARDRTPGRGTHRYG